MKTWEDSKKRIIEINPEMAKDFEEIEMISNIVGSIIEQRHKANLSQRDLAKLCKIPHSSIARIESGKTTPNISTLVKILSQLNLKIEIKPN